MGMKKEALRNDGYISTVRKETESIVRISREDFKARIQKGAEEQKLTTPEMAFLFHVSEVTVNCWLRGKQVPEIMLRAYVLRVLEGFPRSYLDDMLKDFREQKKRQLKDARINTIRKSAHTSAQLCWDCANACGGCRWSSEFKPVNGWTAKEVYVGQKDRGAYTYFITECPEFKRDGMYNGLVRYKDDGD